MMDTSPHTTLALDSPSSRRAQARESLAERMGAIVIAIVLLIALAGFLGPSPLTFKEKQSDDGQLVVEYYLVERDEAPSKMIFYAAPASEGDLYRLAFGREFIDHTLRDHLVPDPVAVEVKDQFVVFTFRIVDRPDWVKIVYQYTYHQPGRYDFQVSLNDRSTIEIGQYVCP